MSEDNEDYKVAPKMPSLYSLSSAMVALIDNEDATPEDIEAAFGEIVAKDNRILCFRADLVGEVAKFKAEEQRIAAARKRMENLIERLEGYIKTSMEMLAVEEVTAGTFSIKLATNPPSVQVEDESLIPNKFFTVIPQTLQLDKKMVADELKKDIEVPGCSLVRNKSLRIK